MLLTKLHIPSPGSNIVHRPNLIEKLNAGTFSDSGTMTINGVDVSSSLTASGTADYTVTYKKTDEVVDQPTTMGDYAITVTTINNNY